MLGKLDAYTSAVPTNKGFYHIGNRTVLLNRRLPNGVLQGWIDTQIQGCALHWWRFRLKYVNVYTLYRTCTALQAITLNKNSTERVIFGKVKKGEVNQNADLQ
jgi:hypothetical protein